MENTISDDTDSIFSDDSLMTVAIEYAVHKKYGDLIEYKQQEQQTLKTVTDELAKQIHGLQEKYLANLDSLDKLSKVIKQAEKERDEKILKYKDKPLRRQNIDWDA